MSHFIQSYGSANFISMHFYNIDILCVHCVLRRHVPFARVHVSHLHLSRYPRLSYVYIFIHDKFLFLFETRAELRFCCLHSIHTVTCKIQRERKKIHTNSQVWFVCFCATITSWSWNFYFICLFLCVADCRLQMMTVFIVHCSDDSIQICKYDMRIPFIELCVVDVEFICHFNLSEIECIRCDSCALFPQMTCDISIISIYHNPIVRIYFIVIAINVADEWTWNNC